MRIPARIIAVWFCLASASTFALDPAGDDSAGLADEPDGFSIFEKNNSRPLIDPDSVARRLPGPSEADRVDTPEEKLATFASVLWAYFSSDRPYQFKLISPDSNELGTVLEISRKSRLLASELQRIRKKSMCDQLSEYRGQGYARNQSVRMAIEEYESGTVKEQEYEEVASFIREEIVAELDSQFLSGFEKEAELFFERGFAASVSARSFFGQTDNQFVADCKVK